MTKATYKSKRWHIGDEPLRPAEAAIFLPLMFRQFVSKDDMVEILYPNPNFQAETAYNLIAVMVCRINKKLKRAGCKFKIKSDYRRRYGLVRVP